MYQGLYSHQISSHTFPSNLNMSYGNPIYLNRTLNNPIYNVPFNNGNIYSNNFPLYTFENPYINIPQMLTPTSINASNYSLPLKAQNILPSNQTNLIPGYPNIPVNLAQQNHKYPINSEAQVKHTVSAFESHKEIKTEFKKETNYHIRHISEIEKKSKNLLQEEYIQSKHNEENRQEIKNISSDKKIPYPSNKINSDTMLNQKLELKGQLNVEAKREKINVPQLNQKQEIKNMNLLNIDYLTLQESGYFKIPQDEDKINESSDPKKGNKKVNNELKLNKQEGNKEKELVTDSHLMKGQQKPSEQTHSSHLIKLDENTFKKFDSLSDVLVSYALFDGNAGPK